MKLRTYLRLLQPIPALILTSVFTLGAFGGGVLFFKIAPVDSMQLAVLVALPLLLGMDLAAAAHTAMHRPFSPLLPGLPATLGRATLAAAPLCAVGVTALVAWRFPATPAAAVFGLAIGLLALPALNRRELVLRVRPGRLTLNLAGLHAPLQMLLAWALFAWLVGPRLILAMQAAPWLFFTGGSALAAWAFARAFARDDLRERAQTPFMSLSATWRVLLHTQIAVRHRAELAQHLSRASGRPSESLSGQSPAWLAGKVGAGTRDWLRVLWHASYGATPRGSFARAQRGFCAMMLLQTFMLPAAGFIENLFQKSSFHFSDYLETLATLSQHDFPARNGAGNFTPLFVVAFAFVMMAGSQLRPQGHYPISRTRLARVSFANAFAQLAATLAAGTLALFLATVIGQLATGRIQPGLGLPALLCTDLALTPVLLLVAATGWWEHRGARLAALVVLGLLVFTGKWWSVLVAGPAGIAMAVAASALAAGVLHWQIRRYYRTCDLATAGAQAPLVFATHGTSIDAARAH